MSYVVCPDYGVQSLRDAADRRRVVAQRPVLQRGLPHGGEAVPGADTSCAYGWSAERPFTVRGGPVLRLQVGEAEPVIFLEEEGVSMVMHMDETEILGRDESGVLVAEIHIDVEILEDNRD